jgi:BirA family biotin operon repressor/biotin-[acetyl-CoA-carboxylase] ligase
MDTRHIFQFGETDSTNSKAHELARQGYPEGTLILADHQTSGRGQFGRTWHSPDGKGVYLSLVLRPDTSPARIPGITLLTAVCLAETFSESHGLEISIKWPNDILVRGRKLSGILTEMVLTGDILDYVIVGVGINLTQGMDDFPEEIRPHATSFMLEVCSYPDREAIIAEFLERFEKAYRVFLERGIDSFAGRWTSLSGMMGRIIAVESAGATMEGTAAGIDDMGALLVRCRDGCIRRIISGRISLIG